MSNARVVEPLRLEGASKIRLGGWGQIGSAEGGEAVGMPLPGVDEYDNPSVAGGPIAQEDFTGPGTAPAGLGPCTLAERTLTALGGGPGDALFGSLVSCLCRV